MAEETQQSVDMESSDGPDNTIRNHVIGSMGVGLIPIPVVDLVALTGIQLNMLRKLANTYGVPFAKDTVKSVLASLIGGGLPVTFSSAFASLMKTVPLIGQTTGALALPILSGATTYAVGKVFTQHFASGGTFLNFDPETVREYYYEMFKEGQDLATNMKDKEKKPGTGKK